MSSRTGYSEGRTMLCISSINGVDGLTELPAGAIYDEFSNEEVDVH